MRRVDQAYRYWLSRSAAEVEQRGWLPVVMGSADVQLREEIIVSDEYWGGAGPASPGRTAPCGAPSSVPTRRRRRWCR
jgi:hypothetical protein